MALLFPVRCFSCQKPLAFLSEQYISLITETQLSHKDALDALHIDRICCRGNMLSPSRVYFNEENRAFIETGKPSTFEDAAPRLVGTGEAKILRFPYVDSNLPRTDPTSLGTCTINPVPLSRAPQLPRVQVGTQTTTILGGRTFLAR